MATIDLIAEFSTAVIAFAELGFVICGELSP
jgi:hypothetical protein